MCGCVCMCVCRCAQERPNMMLNGLIECMHQCDMRVPLQSDVTQRKYELGVSHAVQYTSVCVCV